MRVIVDVGPYGTALIDGLAKIMPGIEFAADGEGEVFLSVPYAARDLRGRIPPATRWVHNLGAGVDGVPLEEIGDRILTCSRGASAVAIAEFVLAAMLAFEKHLPEAWVSEPTQVGIANLGGLQGRTLGLVGVGAIGSEIATRAAAFGMSILALRRSTTPVDLPSTTRADCKDHLIAAADHIVLAAPATAATRHFIDADALGKTKPTAHLVNVGRGALVDHDALSAALEEGRLAGATLDVTEPEPLPAGHPLYANPRARISPHISWSGPSTGDRIFGIFVDNLGRYARGEPLEGIVDPEQGY